MGLEGEKKRTNVVISKEEITPSTFVPKESEVLPLIKNGDTALGCFDWYCVL